MRTAGNKKAKTLRLAPEIGKQLENVARLTNNSESLITEMALLEYFQKHGYNTRYTMKATRDLYALIRQQGEFVDVIDQQIRNGVSLEEIRQNYQAKYNSPVALIVDEGEHT